MVVLVLWSTAGCAEGGDGGGESATGAAPAGSRRAVDLVAECMRDQGLEVTVLGSIDGQVGIVRDNRVVSDAQFDTAYERCNGELLDTGLIAPPIMDRAALGEQYDRLVEAAECLTALGYDVAPPSSREAYIDSRGAAWSPFDSIGAETGPDERDRAYRECGV